MIAPDGLALSVKPLALRLIGGLAQLARAPALHAGGQRFDSVILHKSWKPEARGLRQD